MIIVRSPLRITLGGGGTDLPSYYRHETGFLIAAAIDKMSTSCIRPSSTSLSSDSTSNA
jgi:D-glycero-alpha-D-manno-heptose-7-phosphate kinase